jgi:hypothetical protein
VGSSSQCLSAEHVFERHMVRGAEAWALSDSEPGCAAEEEWVERWGGVGPCILSGLGRGKENDRGAVFSFSIFFFLISN